MPVRVRYVERTTQPQEAVKLSGAFSFNPEFTFLGSAYDVDPDSGKVWTPASVTRAVTKFGVGYTSSSGAAMSRTGISTAANQSVTFVAAFQATAAQAYNFIGSTSTANSGFTLGDCFGGGASMGIQKGGVAALGTIAYSLNVPYYCVASVDGTAGTYYVLLCNAITGAITEASGSNASSATGGNGTAAVVNLNASPNAFSGSVALVTCAFSAMPIEMGRVLVRNTWQLYEPEQIVVKAGAGAAVPSGVGSATLQRLSASGAGRHGVSGSASATLRPLSASGSGVRGQTGVAAATLPALSASGVGTHGYACAGLATLRPISVTASGVHGVTGAVSATLRAINAAAAGDFTFVGSIEGVGIATLHALTARGVGEHDPGTTDVGGFARPFPGRPGQGISRGIADDRDLLEMLPIVIGVMNHAGR